MNKFYLWMYIWIIIGTTLFNYWVVSPSKSWNNSSTSGYVRSSGWHK